MHSRRSFLKTTSATAGLFLLSGNFWVRGMGLINSPEEYITAETQYGSIRGSRSQGVNAFNGIPYAGSVSGLNRFKMPAQLKPWTGIRDALTLGAPAIQAPRRGEPQPDEDCLFLNVWTPANDNKKRTVMFYNHGGGFVIGSGGSAGQDGANLARNFDVVVVETNHRLGILGFLYLDAIGGEEYAGSGNMGLLDITEGLKWVHNNIESFGGDPENVMIFGESGGGAKTSCLYTMPAAAPYFNKASIESGPGVRMLTKEMAEQNTEMILRQFGLTKSNWRKLLDIPAAEILKVQSQLPFVPPFQERTTASSLAKTQVGGVGPVIDGVVMSQHPFDPVAPAISKDKPLMVGWNEDEYTFFAWERRDTEFANLDFKGLEKRLTPQFGNDTQKIISTYRQARPQASAADIFIAVSSITMMGLGSVEIAEAKLDQQSAPVYLYNFGYKSERTIPGTDYPMGTPHAMDISFKFNNEVPPKAGEKDQPSFFGGGRPERFEASHKMASYWTGFAKTGKPHGDALPEWPEYNLNNKPMMRIAEHCEVIDNRFAQELAMWREIGRLPKQTN